MKVLKMRLKTGIISIVLIVSQINQSLAHSHEFRPLNSIRLCLENRTIEVDISSDDLTCQANQASSPEKFRDDYTLTPGIGWHKFHTQARTWNEARKACLEEGAHLAIINSKAEEYLLRNMYRKQLDNISQAKTKNEAFLGVQDEYEEGDWVTVTGESLLSSGYVNWANDKKCWGPQPDGGRVQNCAALSLNCEGMGDTWCTMPLAFFCEKADLYIQ